MNGVTGRVPHTALHLAATHGHTKVVKLLIEHGAVIDSRDKLQRTPLHRSVSEATCLVCSVQYLHDYMCM